MSQKQKKIKRIEKCNTAFRLWLKQKYIKFHCLCWSLVCNSLLSPCLQVSVFFRHLLLFAPFSLCTWQPPLCLSTDSSFSARLQVITRCQWLRLCEGGKCAAVARHRGSQVDALTKLEVDTRRDPQVGPSCLLVCPFCWRTWSWVCWCCWRPWRPLLRETVTSGNIVVVLVYEDTCVNVWLWP